MTSSIETQRSRLLRHGFIFLFVAVWLGIATAILPHPRASRAAHLTALLTWFILVAIGLSGANCTLLIASDRFG